MPQEDEEDMFAFQEWKKKWGKEYATPNEEKTRFENFKENLRTELVNCVPLEPIWTVLNQYADLHLEEHYGYIRLDYNVEHCDSDEDMYPDAKYVIYWPVKQEDGTIRLQDFYPPSIHFDRYKFVQEELQRQRAEKEVDQDAAVKHKTAVPPGNRSSDDKDDTKEEDQDGTVKRQKIG